MRLRFALLSVLLGATGSACPCDPATSGDASDAAAACNALDLCTAPSVSITTTPTPFPVATGGTIRPGRYELTAMRAYVPGSGGGLYMAGNDLRVVLSVSGSTFEEVIDRGLVWRSSSTVVLAGANLTENVTCPTSGATFTETYTASANDLYIYGNASSTPQTEAHFVRR